MALVRKSKLTDGLGVGLALVLGIVVFVADAGSLVAWSGFGLAAVAVLGGLAAALVLGGLAAARAKRRR